MTRPLVVAVALAVTTVWLLGPVSDGAGASPADSPTAPTITLSTGTTRAGSPVVVQLSGWPVGVATIAVCGDAAHRGSVDCDQIGSRGVGIPATGAASVRLVVRPPIGCPCVVRVSTPSSDLVRTVPIDVPGVEVLSDAELAPELLPSVDPATIEVTARVERQGSWSGEVLSALGGPGDRRLVLTVRNVGPAPVAGISVSGAIGRSRSGGVPLTVPPLGTLAPGEERTVLVAVPLPALAAGSYVVFGRVDSMAGAATFETPTDAHPWGLLVVAGLMVVIVVGNRVRRPVRRETARTTVSDHDTSIPAGVQLGDGGGRAPGRGEQHEQRLVGVGAPEGDGVRRTER